MAVLWRSTHRRTIRFPEPGPASGLRRALKQARGLQTAVDFDQALFVGTRDLVVRKRKDSILTGWRLALFAFLYRNSVKVVDRFSLAPENVIEIATQIEI